MCASDNPVRQPRHPTVRVWPLELWQMGPPDNPVVHQTGIVHCPVRLLAPALTLRALPVHCSAFTGFRWSWPLRCSRCTAGTPDSPVLHRTVRWIIAEWHFQKPEGGEFELIHPGAPDTVRWCARPGQPSVFFCSFLLNPILDFLLVCVEPLAPVELII
jgi:hypothetical protein